MHISSVIDYKDGCGQDHGYLNKVVAMKMDTDRMVSTQIGTQCLL